MIIGSKILYYENLTSTNSFAGDLIEESDQPEGTIIRAGFQSEGRGEKGSKWESEEDKNLLFSIILFPTTVMISNQFYISMAISLGIRDFLAEYTDRCFIKWPNDIYVNNDKIAGLLIENSIIGDKIENSVIGIGLNINQEKFISDAPNPVSLKIVTGKTFEPETSLKKLLAKLDARYKQLIAEEYTAIRKEYTDALYQLGEQKYYLDSEGRFSGTITGITDSGQLIIETGHGQRKEYLFKEVEYII